MKTEQFTYQNLEGLATLLRSGEVVAFPTETVYGLGVIYDSKSAYDKLMVVKQRPENKPFTLMCVSVEEIKTFAKVSKVTSLVISEYMPGPLTLVLPSKPGIPEWVDLNTGKVGVRISNLQFLQELIIKVGKPLLVPSANITGETPALTGEEVLRVFDGLIAGVLMGNTSKGQPSTVIEMGPPIKLIRQGPISLDDILRTAKEKE
jgi:L-threonylcarbamoyladenylate synthase